MQINVLCSKYLNSCGCKCMKFTTISLSTISINNPFRSSVESLNHSLLFLSNEENHRKNGREKLKFEQRMGIKNSARRMRAQIYCNSK